MRLYRTLLHLFPSSFRAEYGGELCATFAERRRDATHPLAIAWLWLEVVADTFVSAALTHWDILRQDLRLAVRTLARTPGFTLTAIVVAALGIGANTAVFSITDHVLVRPLPYADASRLVRFWEDHSTRGYPTMETSPANYRDWKQSQTAFEVMGVFRWNVANMSTPHGPEHVDGASVSVEVFPMLGVQPTLGRLFLPEDDREGAPGTILLSDGLWKDRFGGDPRILGSRILLDGQPYDVIGVMPPGLAFPRRNARFWTAMRLDANDFANRGNNWIHPVAKLRRGVSLDQARAQMNGIAARLEREYPENHRIGVRVNRFRDEIDPRTRLMLTILMTASIGVLLIACANLANLLLARAIVRRRELALRTALGAGRERLVRQLMTESLLLAGAGGALGVALAFVGVPLLAQLVPNSLPIGETPSIDTRMLGLAAVLTAITGIGFGVLPALRACGRLNAAALQEGSRGGVGGRRERLRGVLVISAITVSVALSIASGLLIRALWQVQSIDPGFRTAGVLTLRTSLPMPKYEATARRGAFYARVLGDIRALPGVTEAGYISFLPIVMRGGVWRIDVPGMPADEARPTRVSMRFVTPGFFGALDIPLREGRHVRETDTVDAPRVAVVSESFVKQFVPPGQPALGRRFTIADLERLIVGVVGDIRVRGLELRSEPQVYLPWLQVPDGAYEWYAPKDLVIRSSQEPGALMPAVREIITRADPELPISDVQTLGEVVAMDTASRVAQLRVLGAFTLVALLLAAIGIHGLLSFAVSHRAPEIGVRMAMGAQARDILGMILGEGLWLATIGIALGVGVAYVAGRGLEAMLAGIRPGDLPTFALVVGVAMGMTLAGSLLPALRAVRVDPLSVMRAE